MNNKDIIDGIYVSELTLNDINPQLFEKMTLEEKLDVLECTDIDFHCLRIAELAHHLAAKPARRAVVRHDALRPAGHGDGQNLALACVDGLEDRRPLGAHRSAIRGVFDICAAVDLAGRGEYRRADMEVRVRRV